MDLNGKPFARYSDSYINSLDFRLAGKSPSEVNLKLTEEMLQSMTVVSNRPGAIEIGFDNANAEKKAEWAEASDNGPSRKFFGIREDELNDILSTYQAPDRLPDGLGEDLLSRLLRLR